MEYHNIIINGEPVDNSIYNNEYVMPFLPFSSDEIKQYTRDVSHLVINRNCKSKKTDSDYESSIFSVYQIDEIAKHIKNGRNPVDIMQEYAVNLRQIMTIAYAYGIDKRCRPFARIFYIKMRYSKNNNVWEHHNGGTNIDLSKTIPEARREFKGNIVEALKELYKDGLISENTNEEQLRYDLIDYIEPPERLAKADLELHALASNDESYYTNLLKQIIDNEEMSDNDKRVLEVLNGNLDAIAATDEDDSEERVYYRQTDEHNNFDPELGVEDTEEDEENIEEPSTPVSQPVSSPTRNVGAVTELLESLLKDRGNDISISRMVKLAKAYEQSEMYEACDKLDKAIYRAATADFVGIYNELTSATAKLMGLVNKESAKTEENTRV